MYRLLIVDDEEIITDGLYDVFCSLMPEQLDVCKAYSGKEALGWMARTRIDIVLTDIAMPELNGLELIERVQDFWPRCKVIFLTGHDNFDYVYQAIQMNQVRYLLKTEGYDKVINTVIEVINEMKRSHIETLLLEQTEEQKYAYELMAQSDFMRHLLQKRNATGDNQEMLLNEFKQLNISLNPTKCVHMVLGRLDYPKDKTYTERSKILTFVRTIWDHHLHRQMKSIGIVDRYGDIVWFIQSHPDKRVSTNHLIDYVEGTLELIQEECLGAIALTIHFTLGTESCEWDAVSQQYETLRQLQQLKIGNGFPEIVKQHEHFNEDINKGVHANQKIELLTAHLEANRAEEFFDEFNDLQTAAEHGNFHHMLVNYFSIALVLYSHLSQNGWHHRIIQYDKLFKVDEHASMKESFHYLKQVANEIFQSKKNDDRNRATKIIDGICHYIEDHLNEDLSLVRLAEMHFFNPSYLSYFFKQERGINLSEYIDNCRLRKAKQLLRDSDLKVREVSALVGYHAAHSFTRFFKKMTGVTPKEYRENLQKE
ncbi:two-component system, response regulator YesN [Evansella caseinilytica]|uniref:Two-component system, response regulator YesN n=1 Tax=Evansella caseinilytica TaxID=1503961 RepID=A0A1H3NUD4_9BACI|nr:response regulator [Evansella caseinilytica]SDY92313.1 two-component system, response regulator YesN [Evansella caseinilytica]